MAIAVIVEARVIPTMAPVSNPSAPPAAALVVVPAVNSVWKPELLPMLDVAVVEEGVDEELPAFRTSSMKASRSERLGLSRAGAK
jgi:hypothetical protein